MQKQTRQGILNSLNISEDDIEEAENKRVEYEESIFLGSRADGESEIEQIEREAQWKEDHACQMCGSFECDGCHEDTWYDYAEKVGILEAEGCE